MQFQALLDAAAQLPDDEFIRGFAELMDRAADVIKKNNVEKGWFERPRTPGDSAALINTEVAEFYEEFRTYGVEHYMRTRIQDGKPEGGMVELADIFIRVLDTATRGFMATEPGPFGGGVRLQTLGQAFLTKFNYNRTRPKRHGGMHA